jgi:hypothetical protein
LETVTLRWFEDGPAFEYVSESLGLRERIYVLGYPKVDGIKDLARFQSGDGGLVSGELEPLTTKHRPKHQVAFGLLPDKLLDLFFQTRHADSLRRVARKLLSFTRGEG